VAPGPLPNNWPKRCSRLALACAYAFNMATFPEKLEGHLVPLLIRVLGMRRFAKFVVSQGSKQLGNERADWVVSLIADQDRKLMVSAWRAAMAFDIRRRLAEIKCPTLRARQLRGVQQRQPAAQCVV
jgi:hypothetical protein